jgi:hypothetical protein
MSLFLAGPAIPNVRFGQWWPWLLCGNPLDPQVYSHPATLGVCAVGSCIVVQWPGQFSAPSCTPPPAFFLWEAHPWSLLLWDACTDQVDLGDTTANDLSLELVAIPFEMVASLIVLMSYTLIVKAVLKLHLAKERHKALSTCIYCLMVVIMYFGPSTYVYLQSLAKSSQAKFMSFFHCSIHLSTP